MVQVRSQAPTRIDLAGGTLDLWPIHHLLDHKATVNVGITLPAVVELTTLPKGELYELVSVDQKLLAKGDFSSICATTELPLVGRLIQALWRPDLPAVKLVTTARSPAGAGLGGSSCLGVAIAGALLRAQQLLDQQTPSLDEKALLETVQNVEARLIHAPTGVQDYWGGLRGGVNVLTFPYRGVQVETLPPSRLAGLEQELIVCYSGKSRASAINNWEIFKRLFDGDRKLLALFNEIGAAAEQCAAAVRVGDFSAALAASQAEWRLRVDLWPNIETVETKALDTAGREAGARFSRVCGAGGGGVMAVFAPKDRRKAVEQALTKAGGTILDAVVATHGLTVSS